MKMSRLLVAAIVVMTMALSVPTIAAEKTKAADTEINLGGGHPLWSTHTNDDNNHFDGDDSWLGFASIDKKVKDSKWLSYGLMYNYVRIKMGVEKTTTKQDNKWDRCRDRQICPPPPPIHYGDDYYPFPIDNPEYTVTTETHDWLSVHVLGPYAKPYWQISKRLKAFATVGGGLMYVDGKIYGDEFGGAGFVSAGLTLDLYKNFGISGQVLGVQGFTKQVEDIKYVAPVLSFKFSF